MKQSVLKLFVFSTFFVLNLSFPNTFNAYCADNVMSIAIDKGDIAMVQSLVEYGADVNSSDGTLTPLTRALLRRKADIVRYLIDKGADVNKIDDRGNSPIVYAIFKPADERKFKSNEEAIEIVNLLLSKGAQLNSENRYEVPILGLVTAADLETNLEIMKLLIAHGAKINGDVATGNLPPIIHLSSSNQVEKIRLLIEYGADVNATTRFGNTAVMNAVKSSFNDSNYDVLLLLLKNNADPSHSEIRDGNPKIKTLFEQFERYRTIKKQK